jgi:DNA-binding ferritin-like protein
LRDRAEEAKTMSDTFRDPEARRMMLEIMERYEKLAWRLEK